MRPVLRAALVAGFLLLAPSVAHAGQYTVDTCSPPGGTASGPAAWVPVLEGAGAAQYDVNQTCAPGPSLSPKEGAAVPTLTSTARLRFEVPVGATIKRALIWSWGYVADSASQWGVRAVDELNRLQPQDFFPQDCSPPYANQSRCTFGDPGQKAVAGRPFHADTAPPRSVDTRRLEYLLFCAAAPGGTCPGGLGQAGVSVYASRITVEENGLPQTTLSGSLASTTWTNGTDLTHASSDPTGIRAVRVLVDGAPVASSVGTCRTDTTKPCDDLAATDQLTLAEGSRAIVVEATDGAGNVSSTASTALVDRSPPAVALVPGRGRTVTVEAPDGGSGLAGGTIEWAPRRGAYRALRTTRRGDELRARLPRRRAAGLRLRVTARDAIGNTGAYESGRALKASAGFGSRQRRLVYTNTGRGRTLSGRVRDARGTAIAGVPVTIIPTTLVRGATPGTPVVVDTDARGRFRYRAPAGFSRRLLVRIPPRGDAAGLAVRAALLVRAASTIRASATRVRPGNRVRLRGTLRRGGARVPRGGKLLDLQALDGGRWRTFESVRTDQRGRWRASYRFSSSARGTFPLRVRVRRESTYPFHVGTSRSVRIRVG